MLFQCNHSIQKHYVRSMIQQQKWWNITVTTIQQKQHYQQQQQQQLYSQQQHSVVVGTKNFHTFYNFNTIHKGKLFRQKSNCPCTQRFQLPAAASMKQQHKHEVPRLHQHVQEEQQQRRWYMSYRTKLKLKAGKKIIRQLPSNMCKIIFCHSKYELPEYVNDERCNDIESQYYESLVYNGVYDVDAGKDEINDRDNPAIQKLKFQSRAIIKASIRYYTYSCGTQTQSGVYDTIDETYIIQHLEYYNHFYQQWYTFPFKEMSMNIKQDNYIDHNNIDEEVNDDVNATKKKNLEEVDDDVNAMNNNNQYNPISIQYYKGKGSRPIPLRIRAFYEFNYDEK